MLSPFELDRGIVVRFDPEKLREHGAIPNRRFDLAVRDPHYFVCLGPCGHHSVWVPAYSRHRPGRFQVGYKAGSHDWTGQDSFVDLDQMWIVPDDAIAPAEAIWIVQAVTAAFDRHDVDEILVYFADDAVFDGARGLRPVDLPRWADYQEGLVLEDPHNNS